MKIGIYHGYELTGSGSNEYNRYLTRALSDMGHEVHILCRELNSVSIPHINRAFRIDKEGHYTKLYEGKGSCTLYQLPDASIKPVYLTDKQRPGNVKSFPHLTDEEIREYHHLNETILLDFLKR